MVAPAAHPTTTRPPAGRRLGCYASIATTTVATSRTTTPAIAQDQQADNADDTFDQESILNEATGLFGKGAQGIARVIEKIFADLGRPNAYIAGNEVSGAIAIGLRYGDSQLVHKIEGSQRIHWTGPSIGFDVGGNGSKVFTLIYNLYDTEDIFKRFPGGEGNIYYIGGIGVNYQRSGNIVIAPIRLGVGLRAGVNVGWMKYSKRRKWLPF